MRLDLPMGEPQNPPGFSPLLFFQLFSSYFESPIFFYVNSGFSQIKISTTPKLKQRHPDFVLKVSWLESNVLLLVCFRLGHYFFLRTPSQNLNANTLVVHVTLYVFSSDNLSRCPTAGDCSMRLTYAIPTVHY